MSLAEKQLLTVHGTNLLSSKDGLRAHVLRAWSNEQLDQLRLFLHAFHANWCKQWGLSEPDLDSLRFLSNVGLCDLDHWVLRPAAPTSPAQRLSPEDLEQLLCEAIFCTDELDANPGGEMGSIAMQTARDAATHWIAEAERRFGIPLLTTAPPQNGSPAPAWEFSGGISLQVPIGTNTFALELGAAVVTHCLAHGGKTSFSPLGKESKRSAPLIPVLKAAGAQTVRLQVKLNAVTLSLGELQALQLGDVVPLPQSLDAPVTVEMAGGREIANGWLGQAQERWAVQLHPAPPRAGI
ncbi:FliM/FliN family flagellar motor C-terminal domain-containing protein [Acidovorax facilis]|uniref:FliM/FliN family flagellar motor C-terminal domain-containing protein n=1 Tax=Acidovorax facilis TaxID=12917 RepID=UPI003CFBB88F